MGRERWEPQLASSGAWGPTFLVSLVKIVSGDLGERGRDGDGKENKGEDIKGEKGVVGKGCRERM